MWLVLEVSVWGWGWGCSVSMWSQWRTHYQKLYFMLYVASAGGGGGCSVTVCGGNGELITKNYISCNMIFFYLDILIQLKIYTMTYSYAI